MNTNLIFIYEAETAIKYEIKEKAVISKNELQTIADKLSSAHLKGFDTYRYAKNDGKIWILAKKGKEIIAFLAIKKVKPAFRGFGYKFELGFAYVNPEYRGLGLYNQLFNKAINLIGVDKKYYLLTDSKELLNWAKNKNLNFSHKWKENGKFKYLIDNEKK